MSSFINKIRVSQDISPPRELSNAHSTWRNTFQSVSFIHLEMRLKLAQVLIVGTNLVPQGNAHWRLLTAALYKPAPEPKAGSWEDHGRRVRSFGRRDTAKMVWQRHRLIKANMMGFFAWIALLAHQSQSNGTLHVRKAAWYSKIVPIFSDSITLVGSKFWHTFGFCLSTNKPDMQ